ncbi:MAG TPA: hypothetical protein V6D27_01035 [Vampirovibrionales bacterium]
MNYITKQTAKKYRAALHKICRTAPDRDAAMIAIIIKINEEQPTNRLVGVQWRAMTNNAWDRAYGLNKLTDEQYRTHAERRHEA